MSRTKTTLKLALLAALCLEGSGCARRYWRKQADDLAYNIIRDKQNDQRWVIDRVRVEPDARSRFAMAYDPDFEPLPPDDLAAHEFMHWAYGRRGWKHWHEFGDVNTVENPKWLEPFGGSKEMVEGNMGRPGIFPEFNMTLEDAIDLSYIHSRDYQTQIENLYLAALSLTLQRFAFDVQFIGINGKPSSSLTFTDIPSTSDTIGASPSVGVQQLLPTGAQWAVELANNTLWLFAKGDSTQSTASTLSYSLIQPLLANGGRRFVMENLTQAERNVLYAARDLARYRQGFFTSTVAGGFTAGIATGVPGVFTGGPTIPTAIANIPGASQGGYLGLMQVGQTIANTEYNIRQLRDQLDRLRAQAAERPEQMTEPLDALPPGLAFPDVLGGRMTYDADEKQLVLRGTLNDVEARALLALSNDPAFQRAITSMVDRSNMLTTNQSIVQLETQLAQNIQTLRQARLGYMNGLDSYKLQLGLPIDMNITIDLSMLKPFELVDLRLNRLQDRLNAFVLEPPPVPANHPDAAAMIRVAELMQRLDPQDLDVNVLRGLVDEMLEIRNDLQRGGFDVVEDDYRRFLEHQELAANKPKIDSEMHVARDPNRDARLKAALLAEFHEAGAILVKLKESLLDPDVDAKDLQDALATLADLREDLLRLSQSLSVVQIDLRVELVDLPPWDMAMEETVATGLANRLDLMNARAQVMDNRRKIEVAANQLQSVLNVVATGNVNTLPLVSGNNEPFDFRGNQSSFQVGVQFTAPIQLVVQRNNYRAAVIGYLQARRNYLRTEDQVKFDCRTTWRQLDLNRRNFETIREQIRAATAQLDIAAEQTAAPAGAAPAPGAAGGGGGGGGGTAQGLQIIQAVQSVLQAQNNLISAWINYEAFRLDIYNFMGTLEIDREGYWTDEFYQARARAHRADPNRRFPPLPGVSYGPEQELLNTLPNGTFVDPDTMPPQPMPGPEDIRAQSAEPAGHGRVASKSSQALERKLSQVRKAQTVNQPSTGAVATARPAERPEPPGRARLGEIVPVSGRSE